MTHSGGLHVTLWPVLVLSVPVFFNLQPFFQIVILPSDGFVGASRTKFNIFIKHLLRVWNELEKPGPRISPKGVPIPQLYFASIDSDRRVSPNYHRCMTAAPHGTHNKHMLVRNESIANHCKDCQIAMIANEDKAPGQVAPLSPPHKNKKPKRQTHAQISASLAQTIQAQSSFFSIPIIVAPQGLIHLHCEMYRPSPWDDDYVAPVADRAVPSASSGYNRQVWDSDSNSDSDLGMMLQLRGFREFCDCDSDMDDDGPDLEDMFDFDPTAIAALMCISLPTAIAPVDCPQR